MAATGFLDEMRNAGLADLTEKAVDLVAEGKGEQRYKEAMKELDGSAAPDAQASGSPASESSSDGTGGWWLWPLIAVPALALTALATRALVRSPRTPSAIPQLVFATARAVDEAGLRRRAEAEVLALGEATQAADTTTTPDLQRSRRLRRRRHGPRRGPGPVGPGGRPGPGAGGPRRPRRLPEPPPVLLRPPARPRALRTGWRQLGRRDRLDVAVCQECADALQARRAPEVLTDTDEDGRTVPYFELPAGRSVWAATGYGSLMSPLDGFNARRTATR
ncbi:hypothetical protein ACH4HG_00630 [Streptomyces coeruleorubidus]|uniref:hypothetical protein n=1 Tax=Streptomyces coeruleorubidus TaxID=116188 RepID=UPI0037A201B2